MNSICYGARSEMPQHDGVTLRFGKQRLRLEKVLEIDV
jgi:hypothetical protein